MECALHRHARVIQQAKMCVRRMEYSVAASYECGSTEKGCSGVGCGQRWGVGFIVATVGRGGRDRMVRYQTQKREVDRGIGYDVEDKVVDVVIVVIAVLFNLKMLLGINKKFPETQSRIHVHSTLALV